MPVSQLTVPVTSMPVAVVSSLVFAPACCKATFAPDLKNKLSFKELIIERFSGSE